MARKPAKSKTPTFEDALRDLESLVEAMENDQLPLEDLVAHYEKGAGLLQHCEQILETARKRIELIELTPPAENKLESSPAPDEDPATSAASAPATDDNDDIRLF